MTVYQGIAGKVSEGMETIGEQLEESGHPLKGSILQSPAVRSRVSEFVGDHPWMVAGMALAGLGAYLYFRD